MLPIINRLLQHELEHQNAFLIDSENHLTYIHANLRR